MKYLSLSLIMALGFLLASVFAHASETQGEGSQKKVSAALSSASTVKMKIKGLVCAFCAQGVEKIFKAKAEVTSIKVSLEDMLVTLVLKAGMNIPDEELKLMIKDAGFNVESIDRLSSLERSDLSSGGKK